MTALLWAAFKGPSDVASSALDGLRPQSEEVLTGAGLVPLPPSCMVDVVWAVAAKGSLSAATRSWSAVSQQAEDHATWYLWLPSWLGSSNLAAFAWCPLRPRS